MMEKPISIARSAFNIFKHFVTFCGCRYKEIIFSLVTLLFLSAISLASYYIFIKIQQIENAVVMPTDVQRQQDLVSNTSNNKRVDSILENLLSQKHADRAYLFQFHDSLKTLKGQHFYFASNTNEVVSPGTATELTTLQNIPVGQINDLMDHFLNHECVLQEVSTEALPDNTYRQQFERQGIKTFKVCPVYDVDETVLIGFVGVDWVKQPAQNGDVSKTGAIEAAALKISAIIE
jgi:hypothetical protein